VAQFLWICLGGAVGTGARYLVALLALRLLGPAFPWGTLVVNVAGSFLLGAVMHVGLTTEWISPAWRLALTTGVLGGVHDVLDVQLRNARLPAGGRGRDRARQRGRDPDPVPGGGLAGTGGGASPDRVEKLVPILDEMVSEGLVTLEKVRVLKYAAGPPRRP
jgi:hypothetical protein